MGNWDYGSCHTNEVCAHDYCLIFKNEIVRAYALDHFFYVILNSIGLAAAVLSMRYHKL